MLIGSKNTQHSSGAASIARKTQATQESTITNSLRFCTPPFQSHEDARFILYFVLHAFAVLFLHVPWQFLLITCIRRVISFYNWLFILFSVDYFDVC